MLTSFLRQAHQSVNANGNFLGYTQKLVAVWHWLATQPFECLEVEDGRLRDCILCANGASVIHK